MQKLVVVIVTAFSLNATAAFAQLPQVKFSLANPPDSPPSRGAQLLAQKLADAKIMRLELLPAATVAAPMQMPDIVKTRVLDMAVVPTEALVRFNRNFAIFSLPFAFEDLGYVARFQESADGKRLLASLSSAGFEGLAYWSVEMVQLFSQRPIRAAGDLKGLKVASGGNAIAKSVFDQLGANTVTFPAGDIAAALSKGLVDASESTIARAQAIKLPSFQKYLNLTNQQYQGVVLIANSSFWAELKPEERTKTRALIDEVTRQVDEFAIDQTEKGVATMRGVGLEVVVPEPSARAVWRATASEAWLSGGGEPILLRVAGGAEGGGDVCGPGLCRCLSPARTCSRDCCRRPRVQQ